MRSRRRPPGSNSPAPAYESAVNIVTTPLSPKARSAAGPARPMASPVRTKMPAPIMAPTPIIVASKKPRFRDQFDGVPSIDTCHGGRLLAARVAPCLAERYRRPRSLLGPTLGARCNRPLRDTAPLIHGSQSSGKVRRMPAASGVRVRRYRGNRRTRTPRLSGRHLAAEIGRLMYRAPRPVLGRASGSPCRRRS